MYFHARISTIILSAVMASTTLSVGVSASESLNTPNLYGFLFSNTPSGWSYGVGRLEADNADQTLLPYRHQDGKEKILYTGSGKDGVIYGLLVEPGNTEADLSSGTIIQWNSVSGFTSIIGKWELPDVSYEIRDLTIDSQTGAWFVLANREAKSFVFRLNPLDGDMNLICEIKSDFPFISIAATNGGLIYAMGADGIIYHVNSRTGVATNVVNTRVSGLSTMQTMTFGSDGSTLYFSANTPENSEAGHSILASTIHGLSGTVPIPIMQFSPGTTVTALYADGPYSGEMLACPENIRASYEKNTGGVRIFWNNPFRYVSGEELNNDSPITVSILRNGVQIANIPQTNPGEALEYYDPAPERNQENHYQLQTSVDDVPGVCANIYVYSGEDIPAAVGEITVNGEEEYRLAEISWNEVTRGFHGGEIDPTEIRYTVVRQPDGAIIADNLTLTQIIDSTITHPGNYYYEVTASNNIGTSLPAMSGRIVLGGPVDAPISIDFSQCNYEDSILTVVDGNNDLNTWFWENALSSLAFGDYDYGLTLAAGYEFGPFSRNADDWLISGPINLSKDIDWQLEIGMRSTIEGRLMVYTGINEDPYGMELKDVITIPASTRDGNSRIKSTVNKVMLEKGISDSPVCLGLRMINDKQDTGLIQITSIALSDSKYDDLNEVNSDSSELFLDGMTLVVKNCEGGVTIHDMSGKLIKTFSGERIILRDLDRGVYIATAKTEEGIKTIKFRL